MCIPFDRAITAPKKITHINKKIVNSPAQAKAEFKTYLKITWAKVISIMIENNIAIIGLKTKLIKSLFGVSSVSDCDFFINFNIALI